ncbi:hypothetical protein [Vibrio jasicida]|uniref:hypothetical protein n=1 Tax=Vibrio jasicida TaxID=766224 RepID=UPI000AB4F496|nr:hypothetical protein [Vibrio jasicida]
MGSATSSGNVITYTPRTVYGWDVIEYTLKSTADETKVKTGSIFITVSDEVNQAPVIGQPKYNYNTVSDVIDSKKTPADLRCGGGSCDGDKINSWLTKYQSTYLEGFDGNWTEKIFLPRGTAYEGKVFKFQNFAEYYSYVYDGQRKIATLNRGQFLSFKSRDGQWYPQNTPDPVLLGEKIDLDLSRLQGLHINDSDGDPWQLIHVQSFSASVAAKDPESVTNKVITFRADEPGEHIVSYIVGDNYGGYSSGLIKVNVTVPNKAPTWTDLTTSAGVKFTAPLTYAQATKLGFTVSAINDTEVDNVVAQYNAAAATSYCATKGHLSTESEFLALRAEHWKTDGVGMKKWPQGGVGQDGNYLVRGSGDTYKVVDVKTGEASEATSRTQAYVTCVENNAFSLTMLKTECIANGEPCEVVRVNKPSVADVIKPTMPKVSGTLVEADVDTVISPTSTRHKVVTASSTKAGTYQFGVELQGKWERLATGVINFTRDWAKVVSVLSEDSETKFFANGITSSNLGVRFNDVNGDAVARTSIQARSDNEEDSFTSDLFETTVYGNALYGIRTVGTTVRAIRFTAPGAAGGAIGGTVSITPKVRSYKGEQTEKGHKWTFETTTDTSSVDNIGDTVMLPAGYVLNMRPEVFWTRINPGDYSWFRTGPGYVALVPGTDVAWWNEPISSREECFAALERDGVVPPAGISLIQPYRSWDEDGDGAADHDLCVGHFRNWTTMDDALANGDPSVPPLWQRGGGSEVTNLPPSAIPMVGGAVRTVRSPTTLSDFLSSCTDGRLVSATTNFSSVRDCHHLENTHGIWTNGQQFTTEGRLQNNLGMELGDLP